MTVPPWFFKTKKQLYMNWIGEVAKINVVAAKCQSEIDYEGLSVIPNPSDPIYVSRMAKKDFARVILGLLEVKE